MKPAEKFMNLKTTSDTDTLKQDKNISLFIYNKNSISCKNKKRINVLLITFPLASHSNGFKY